MAKTPTLPDIQRAAPIGRPAVVGIDAGRKQAEKLHRRRRRKDRVVSSLVAVAALGFVAVGAWAGYTIYEEQREQEVRDREERQAELRNSGSGDDLRDAIDELETTPKWNGPGNETFGIGDGSTEP